MTLSSGNQVTYDTGTNRCYSQESLGYEDQWFLSADEQRLFIGNIHPMIGETSSGPLKNYEIVSLTKTELTIKESGVFQDYGGVETTVVNVYTFVPSN